MTVSAARIDRGFAAASLKVGQSIAGPLLLNRRAKLVIRDASASALALTDPKRRTAVVVDQVVAIINAYANDFRVRFSIKRDIYGVPQPCYIEIFGLADGSRRTYQGKKHIKLELIVGYDPPQADLSGPPRDPEAFLKLVGTLNAKQSQPRHDGAEWIFKFEGADGARAHYGSRANKTWAGGTPKAEALGEMLRGLGKVGPGAQALLAKQGAGKVWKNSKTFSGLISRDVAWMLRDLGLQHCIVNEEVILMPINGTTGEVYELSPESGLLGSPEPVPYREGLPHLLKARSLMLPDLRPGALIILTSDAHSGQYRCRSMEHQGDTEGGPWFTEVELQPLKGAR